MTLEKCYALMGADYENFCRRLGSPSLAEKFAVKFLKDNSYEDFCAAVEEKDWAQAFRAVHTLKGVSANLSLSRVQKAAEVLTEHLRGNSPLTDFSLYSDLQSAYREAVQYLAEFAEN